jgi:hypothetical protein
MSIYRKSLSERYAEAARGDAGAETMTIPSAPQPPREIRFGNDEDKRLRKATPANIPLPGTKRWVESLPPEVRPKELIRRFARIANLLAATWDNTEHFNKYMECLLIDKRGGRKGFPPDVLAELKALELYRLSI